MQKIKIKDIPKEFDLVNKILHIPEEYRKNKFELKPKMIIRSGWNKGFWCVKKVNDSRFYPVCFNNFDEIKDWEIEVDDIDKEYFVEKMLGERDDK